jgi:CHAT domain-containing protein
MNIQPKDKLVQARNAEFELDVYRRAGEWDKVRELGQKLYYIKPSYFDLDGPSDSSSDQVKRVLQLGLLKELDAKQATDSTDRFDRLRAALDIYNYGCFAKELYNQHFNATETKGYGFDDSDWANLFSSAARICYYFAKEGYDVPPQECSVKEPKLAAQDWEHQAFHFLEQGRTRALLDSIIRGDFTKGISRRVRDSSITNMDLVVEAAVTMIKKRRSLNPQPAPEREFPSFSLSSELPTLREPTVDEYQSTEIGAPKTSSYTHPNPTLSIPYYAKQDNPGLSKQLHPLSTEGLAGSGATSMTASPSNVFTPDESEQETLTKWRVNMRWRKALLSALAKVNPTLNAVYDAARGFEIHGGIETMRSTIPPDTLIVEYAMTLTAPCGIMTVVAASDGVKAVDWKETNTADILKCIEDLRTSMGTLETRARNIRSPPEVTPRKVPLSRPSGPARRKSAVFQNKLDAILRNIVAPPVKDHLKGKKKLVIVPSGELAHVPWTIFFDMPITVVPSLDIWRRLQAQATRRTPKNPKTFILSSAPEDLESAKKDLPYSRDIPFSRIEALWVARLHNQVPFLADDKDRKTFRALARGTQVLHICAHGTFVPEAPMSSSLYVFKEPLTMLDWHTLSIKADLVVLSSCLSAIWRAYTLLSTGTKAFIGSLWPVDDAATMLLMIMFYEELRRPLPAADALYEAQKRMRHMTENQLHKIIDDLEEMASDDETHNYVVNPQYHINELKELDAIELRDEKYWAAFVLTGYGSSTIYPNNSE